VIEVTKTLVVVVLLAVAVSTGMCSDWGYNPGAIGMLPKLTFGPVGIDAPDPSTTSTASSNPAGAVGLLDLGMNRVAEAEYGWMRFDDGPDVQMDVEFVTHPVGRGLLRVGRYGFSSSTERVPRALPDSHSYVSYHGSAYMLNYAEQSSRLRWGVSWYPQDDCATYLVSEAFDGRMYVAGWIEAESQFHGRAGVQYVASPQLVVGGYYDHEQDRVTTHTHAGVFGRDTYQSHFWTGGMTWTPQRGTSLSLAYQYGTSQGVGLDETVRQWYVCGEQFLSPHWSVRLGEQDHASMVGLGYYSSRAYATLSLSPNSLRRTEAYLGPADTLFLIAGISW